MAPEHCSPTGRAWRLVSTQVEKKLLALVFACHHLLGLGKSHLWREIVKWKPDRDAFILLTPFPQCLCWGGPVHALAWCFCPFFSQKGGRTSRTLQLWTACFYQWVGCMWQEKAAPCHSRLPSSHFQGSQLLSPASHWPREVIRACRVSGWREKWIW